MNLGIINVNGNGQQANKAFPKVVNQAAPVESGMYKAVFTRFVTLGFSEDRFNEGKLKFFCNFGFELIEDMAGNKVPQHWKEFDNGTREEAPKCLFREYPITDRLHHKSGGFAVAKALNPTVSVDSWVDRNGNEHQYITNFDWKAALGTTVLLMIEKKISQAGNPYNQVKQVMPLGVQLDGALVPHVFFNLYDPTLQEVFDKDLFGYEKKRVRESTSLQGEPNVTYRTVVVEEAPAAPVAAPVEPNVAVDLTDDCPF